jgi:hypothetical protein
MWWSIYVQSRGERMEDVVADRSRYLGAFDGNVHGDRQAKKLAKQVGKDYIATGAPGQPRLVKSPLEPWNNDLFAAQAAFDAYPGELDVHAPEASQPLFLAVAGLWSDAWSQGWSDLRPSVFQAFNDVAGDVPDATVDYFVGLQRAGYEWRRHEVDHLDRPASSLAGDDMKISRLATRFRLRSPHRSFVLVSLAVEFQRDGVGEREADPAYREVAAHYIATSIHESFPAELPPGLSGQEARELTQQGMAVFDANWALEVAEARLPAEHAAYVGTIQYALHWGEFYPRVAQVVRAAGWSITEGDPGVTDFQFDQVDLPAEGLLAVHGAASGAPESVRAFIASDSADRGMQIELTVIGGRRALDLGEQLQEDLAYEGRTTKFIRVEESG